MKQPSAPHCFTAWQMAGALLFAALACGGPTRADEWRPFEETRPAMGTQFRIVLYARSSAVAQPALNAAFARIQELEKQLSDYDSESELSRLSLAAPTAAPIKVSPDLWAVLERSQFFAAASEGAFDITIGPYTKLWRRARRQRQLPPAEQLAEAASAVGYAHLLLHPETQTVELKRAAMRLDLGGIAKGYAADAALALLAQRGICHASVAASGDLALGNPPPGEPGWKIGVAPLAENGPPSRWLLLANCGVSTSGDTFQHVEIAGRRYSHIVDPRSGVGLTEPLIVSVVAPNCTTSDALATTISVLGPTRGLALVEKMDQVSALVVRKETGPGQFTPSERFKKLKTTTPPPANPQ